jgi:hypothetical protein
MPSTGGGTSLDQAMLTKTLRPSDIGTGLCACSRVGVASRWSTLDFMQKPGEGEMLMVALGAIMTRSHHDVLGFLVSGPLAAAVFIMGEESQERVRIPLSPLLTSHRRWHGHTPCGVTDSPTQYRR